MAQSDQGGGVEPVDRRLPGQPPKALDVTGFAGRPMTLALLQAVRAVVDADPPGWKRGTIARRLGISASELSKQLSGKEVMKRQTLERLCEVFRVGDEVREQWLRLHIAAFIEVRPRMREWAEQAAACQDAVAHQRETEQRYQRLDAEHRRLQADHQDLLGRHQDLIARHRDTEHTLAQQEQAARLEQERHRQDAAGHAARLDQEQTEHAATRRRYDRARREAEQLRAERDEQQAGIRAAERELEESRSRLADVDEELLQARRERDQARQQSARLCDELLAFQDELLVLREHDQQRRNAEAVVAQAWQTLDDALERSATDHAPDPEGAAPALASAVQPAAHIVVSADGTSPAAAGSGRATPAPTTATTTASDLSTQPATSRTGCITAVTGFVLAIVLFGSGVLVSHATRQPNSPYVWVLVGGSLLSFLVATAGVIIHHADNLDDTNSDDDMVYWGQ